MERSSKRGKIPQHDWPSIIKRYEAGETLASIARTYDCSPPAISYIVSRSRTRDANVQSAALATREGSEQRLIKGHANEMPAAVGVLNERTLAVTSGDDVLTEPSSPVEGLLPEPQHIEPEQIPIETPDTPDLRREPAVYDDNHASEQSVQIPREASTPGNGDPPPSLDPPSAPPQNVEPRRTLHLPLQDGARDAGADIAPAAERSATPWAGGQQQRLAEPTRQGPLHYPPAANGESPRVLSEPANAKEGGAFIDQALRERVDGDIAAFLAAFDAALAHDTLESRAGLREATDRLLRAGARTRIELERLEARLPLSPRDSSRQSPPVWRPR
jgi:hypothetical protein